MKRIFRHSAGFGKRIEYWVIGLMLKEGIDVYVPLVDDNAIDAIIRKTDWFNGKKKDKTTGEYKEHIHERFKRYIVTDFSRFA